MDIMNADNEPTKEFFVFLKYNKVLQQDLDLSEGDAVHYKDFINKWKLISLAFKNDSDDVKSLFGSITTMFGYNRHYCSTCGSPVIGKYSKIGGKIACNPCFESLKIIQLVENIVEPEKKTRKPRAN